MKKTKAPRLVTVAITTTITIVFWIFYTLYNILTKPESLNIDPKLLEPLTPSLDSTSLARLEGRIFFEEDEAITPLVEIASPRSPSPSSFNPTPTIFLEAKEEIPQATNGARLFEF